MGGKGAKKKLNTPSSKIFYNSADANSEASSSHVGNKAQNERSTKTLKGLPPLCLPTFNIQNPETHFKGMARVQGITDMIDVQRPGCKKTPRT